MSFSFAVGEALNAILNWLYTQRRGVWSHIQRAERVLDDRPFDIQSAKIAIIGMGGIGTGTYDRLRVIHWNALVGMDIDPRTVRNQRATGRDILVGDPSDAVFWERVQATHSAELVMLALTNMNTDLAVLAILQTAGFSGKVAATIKFQGEACAGSADHILERRIHRQSAKSSLISAKAGKTIRSDLSSNCPAPNYFSSATTPEHAICPVLRSSLSCVDYDRTRAIFEGESAGGQRTKSYRQRCRQRRGISPGF